MPELHLTIIAKTPVAGRVKTRLCPPCSPEEAALVAAASFRDTIDSIDATWEEIVVTRGRRLRRVVLLEGDRPEWVPDHYEIAPQSAGGLGDRLANGFDVLGAGIVVGMETPHAIRSLTQALDALDAGQHVIGPAVDGGYWAIGLGSPGTGGAATYFAGVEMSTERTGAQQIERLRHRGHEVLVLPTARDLDDVDDLVALAHSGRTGRTATLARHLVDRYERDGRSADHLVA